MNAAWVVLQILNSSTAATKTSRFWFMEVTALSRSLTKTSSQRERHLIIPDFPPLLILGPKGDEAFAVDFN